MGAYIINIPDSVDRVVYINVNPMNGKTYTASYSVENLTPYTEPDLGALAKENFERGYRQRKAEDEKEIQEVYQRGLADAWEAARKIGSNSMCSLKEMGFDFSQCAVSDYNPSWFVVKNYSASEAIEKIRQYEQEKDRQAKIEYNFDEIKDVIETTAKEYNMSLDEIAEVLEKMRGEQDG